MATFIHQLQAVQQRVISAMEATVRREVSLRRVTTGGWKSKKKLQQEKKKKKKRKRLSNKRVQQDKNSSLDCAMLHVTQSHGEFDAPPIKACERQVTEICHSLRRIPETARWRAGAPSKNQTKHCNL